MQFTDWNLVSSIGGCRYGASQLWSRPPSPEVIDHCAVRLVDPDGEELLRIKVQ
jgi:hypothetical protein